MRPDKVIINNKYFHRDILDNFNMDVPDVYYELEEEGKYIVNNV